MSRIIKIIAFILVMCAVVLAALIVFGNDPWVDTLRTKTKILLGRPIKNTNRPLGLDLQEHADYLQSLRGKYADHLPLPKMVTIPAGVFQQGSPDNVAGINSPALPVKAFEIASTETTLEQWDTCVAMGGCTHLPDNYGWGRGDLPALNVSFDDALQYIDWLNIKTNRSYRLPTGEEWEYAARAGTDTLYPWGDKIPNCEQARLGSPAWQPISKHECKITGTWPVAKTQPNAWGLYDVIGNAAEWTTACDEKISRADVSEISRPALEKIQAFKIQTFISQNCSRRINRGGNLMTSAKTVNVFHARAYEARHRYNRVGFRLARDITP